MIGEFFWDEGNSGYFASLEKRIAFERRVYGRINWDLLVRILDLRITELWMFKNE